MDNKKLAEQTKARGRLVLLIGITVPILIAFFPDILFINGYLENSGTVLNSFDARVIVRALMVGTVSIVFSIWGMLTILKECNDENGKDE